MDSSEYIFANGTVTKGPELPNPLFGHCMVKLNTKILITGGLKSKPGADPTPDTVYYDTITGDWENGAKLKRRRHTHACATFNSPKHGNKSVAVVAGGFSLETRSRGPSRKMEVLDYSTVNNKWEERKQILLADCIF